MLMPKANRTQRYGVKDQSNISASVEASRASARMYDELTNSFLNLSSQATTSAINSEIRKAETSGEMAGIEASRKAEKEGSIDGGSFEGYDKKSEIFKWDVASNQSAQNMFDANVKNRASSIMKTLSKEANGDTGKYKLLSKKVVSDAIADIDDVEQRNRVINSYAKSYNQNLPQVHGKFIQQVIKETKDGWDAGRPTFEEDYGIKLAEILDNESKLYQAKLGGYTDAMMSLMDTIESDKELLQKFRESRIASGSAGVQLGAMSVETLEADTHADIQKAISTSMAQRYANTDSLDERMEIRKRINEMPETAGTKDEIFYMSPKGKKETLEALDTAELQESKMWKNATSLEKAQFDIDKKDAVNEIQLNLLDDTDDVYEKIDDAFKAGYINLAQRKAYLDQATNGSKVERDNLKKYGEVVRDIHLFTTDDIANIPNLTDASKRKLINDRSAWEEEGEKWMTNPDYNEGENIIKLAFGFPKDSIMPEFLEPAKELKYKEMLRVLDAHRSGVRTAYEKNDRTAGVRLAEELINMERTNDRSVLYSQYADNKIYTKEMMVEKAKRDNTDIQSVMDKVYQENKKAVFTQDIMDDEPQKQKPQVPKAKQSKVVKPKTNKTTERVLR